jgi:hypothetical protein
MKKIIVVIYLLLAIVLNAQESENIAQVPPPPCYPNGNSGFGGAIGEGLLLKSWDSSTFEFHMSTNNTEINDILVLYFDTGAPGRNVIDETIDDSADDHRTAITNSNAFGFGSTINFPTDFNASYAIAVNINYGGLWSIPSTGSVGMNGLNFVASVNSNLTSNTQNTYVFSIDWTDMGVSSTYEMKFVAVYVSSTAYNSDEGYGVGITSGTQGSDAITFTEALPFPACSNNSQLSDDAHAMETITANYFNNQLSVKGLNDLATIRVYDILGRELYYEQQQVKEQESIPLDLNINELQFIVIESLGRKKVIKVIPN